MGSRPADPPPPGLALPGPPASEAALPGPPASEAAPPGGKPPKPLGLLPPNPPPGAPARPVLALAGPASGLLPVSVSPTVAIA